MIHHYSDLCGCDECAKIRVDCCGDSLPALQQEVVALRRDLDEVLRVERNNYLELVRAREALARCTCHPRHIQHRPYGSKVKLPREKK